MRKILTGKVARIAKKALNKVVGKVLNEVFKRLHIQIPNLRGMDQLQQRLHDTENRIHNAETKVKQATGIPQQLRQIKSSVSSISANQLRQLNVCVEYIPPPPNRRLPPQPRQRATPAHRIPKTPRAMMPPRRKTPPRRLTDPHYSINVKTPGRKAGGFV